MRFESHCHFFTAGKRHHLFEVEEGGCRQRLASADSMGALFWGYSSYSYSGLGITEYAEFQFRKERSQIWKRNTHGGGDLRTTMSAWRNRRERPRRISRQKFPKRTRILRCIPSKPYSFHSVHSAIGIPFIPKTELLPKEQKYRLFRVFLFRNSPKRTQIPTIPSIPIPE